MPIILGDSGVNRTLKDVYLGDSGVNRKQKEIYLGNSGVNRKIYENSLIIPELTVGTTYTINRTFNNITCSIAGGYIYEPTKPPEDWIPMGNITLTLNFNDGGKLRFQHGINDGTTMRYILLGAGTVLRLVRSHSGDWNVRYTYSVTLSNGNITSPMPIEDGLPVSIPFTSSFITTAQVTRSTLARDGSVINLIIS